MRRKMSTLLVSMLMAVGLLGGLMSPATASATSDSVLCKGFSDCNKKKRSNFGFSSHMKKTWWGQKSGQNCTNYAAYRLNSNGRLTLRPAGTASPYLWDDAAKKAGHTVTSKPKVGDVAWWERRVRGAGPNGHVAVVQQVLSNGSIVVSESNNGGTFQWRRIAKGSKKAWPSGFIRYKKADGTPAGSAKASQSSGKIVISGSTRDPDGGDQFAQKSARIGIVWASSTAPTFAEAKRATGAQTATPAVLPASWKLTFSRGKGTHTFTVYAINVNKGKDRRLGTYTVTVK